MAPHRQARPGLPQLPAAAGLRVRRKLTLSKERLFTGKKNEMTDPTAYSLLPTPFPITTPSDLARLAAEMRAHVAATEGVASRVVCLGHQSFQVMLRPGPDNQIQLATIGQGYRFPDAWLGELRAAFGVPDGTLMVYDLVKRHEVVKWTWVEAGPEPLQMSLAGMEVESKSNHYERER